MILYFIELYYITYYICKKICTVYIYVYVYSPKAPVPVPRTKDRDSPASLQEVPQPVVSCFVSNHIWYHDEDDDDDDDPFWYIYIL